MNISFSYLFTETFKTFFQNFGYVTKLALVWLVPLVVMSFFFSTYIIDVESLSLFTSLVSVCFYYIGYLLFLPLVIQKVAFKKNPHYIVPFETQISLILKYVTITLYFLPLLVPLAVLLGFAFVFKDTLVLASIFGVISVLYFIYIMYLGIKLDFAFVNLFDNNLPVSKLFFIRMGFKNAAKLTGGYCLIWLIGLVFFGAIALLIGLGFGFANNWFEVLRLYFSSDLGSSYEFLGKMIIVAILIGYQMMLGVVFLSVSYKKYIKSALKS